MSCLREGRVSWAHAALRTAMRTGVVTWHFRCLRAAEQSKQSAGDTPMAAALGI